MATGPTYSEYLIGGETVTEKIDPAELVILVTGLMGQTAIFVQHTQSAKFLKDDLFKKGDQKTLQKISALAQEGFRVFDDVKAAMERLQGEGTIDAAEKAKKCIGDMTAINASLKELLDEHMPDITPAGEC